MLEKSFSGSKLVNALDMSAHPVVNHWMQLCDLGKCILGVAWNHGMSNDERYNSKCHDGAANEHGLVLKTKKGGPPARTWIPDFDF